MQGGRPTRGRRTNFLAYGSIIISLPCVAKKSMPMTGLTILATNSARAILEQFPEITQESLDFSKPLMAPLHIDTGNSSPVFSKCRKIACSKKREQVEGQIRSWEKQGIIEKVDQAVVWASPIHPVKKADGSWRVTGDFRRLNTVTVMDHYPLPHLANFNERSYGCRVFSKIDLCQAYHQVEVAEEDQIKTTINTTLGLYKFKRMPFGLKNAAQQFQRNVHLILQDVGACFVYMDDIIVMSRSHKEHEAHLRAVFQRLKDHGLLVNKQKCEFAKAEIAFLGHVISRDGIRIPDHRVDAIKRFPKPTNWKEMSAFLGLTGFVHRFIPHLSGLQAPLNRIRDIREATKFKAAWTSVHDSAFVKVKEAIARATLLAHPDPNAPTEIWCDASRLAVGAVLVQYQFSVKHKYRKWVPLAFWSKTLNNAQRGYSATDRELLAASYSLAHFRDFVEGHKVIVRTDHRPLVEMVKKAGDVDSDFQRRHLTRIAERVSDIRYREGPKNLVADALSRVRLETATLADQLEGGKDLRREDSFLIPLVNSLVQKDVAPFVIKGCRERAGTATKPSVAQSSCPEEVEFPPRNTPSYLDYSDILGSESATGNNCQHELDSEAFFKNHPAYISAVTSTDLEFPCPSKIREEQDRDESLQAWIRKHETDTSSRHVPRLKFLGGTFNHELWVEDSSSSPKILVPTNLRRVAFSSVHSSYGHPGVKPTTAMVRSDYFWTNMGKDIARWCKECHTCQVNKIGRHTKTPLEQLPPVTDRFSTIHVDLVGPIPQSEGKNMLLTMVDRATGWPEAVPISQSGPAANAPTCAKILINTWIARFGVPSRIISDNGPQFVSLLWKEIARRMGYRHNFTTAYHPQSNGKVERFHKTLKQQLRCRLRGRTDWVAQLPFALLGTRTLCNSDTGVAPCELVYGQKLDLPPLNLQQKEPIGDESQFVGKLNKGIKAQLTPRPTPWHSGSKSQGYYVPLKLQNCEQVLIVTKRPRNALEPFYTGPYFVKARKGKTMTVLGSAGPQVISMDRCIPYYPES